MTPRNLLLGLAACAVSAVVVVKLSPSAPAPSSAPVQNPAPSHASSPTPTISATSATSAPDLSTRPSPADSALWAELQALARDAQFTEKDQLQYQAHIRERQAQAIFAAQNAATARGSPLPFDDPLLQAIRDLSPDPSRARARAENARQRVSSLLAPLVKHPSDDAVRLIAPLLEAQGSVFVELDYGIPPVQNRALEALQSLQLSGFPLKGHAPGAADVPKFLAAMERIHHGESIDVPCISGSLGDWRHWWQTTKADYHAPFELPADLRAPLARE